MNGLRVAGIALLAVGALAAAVPGWFGLLTGGPEPPPDLYHAIERRIRGGMVFGLGLALMAVPTLRPWSTSIPAGILYLMAGALAARLLGLLVEGNVPRQWLLVAVEAFVMTLAALWLWRSSGSAA